jgi:hypothetical protein
MLRPEESQIASICAARAAVGQKVIESARHFLWTGIWTTEVAVSMSKTAGHEPVKCLGEA